MNSNTRLLFAVIMIGASIASVGASAQVSDGVIKIGILNDQSGIYALPLLRLTMIPFANCSYKSSTGKSGIPSECLWVGSGICRDHSANADSPCGTRCRLR
jgi:hypothetical protein